MRFDGSIYRRPINLKMSFSDPIYGGSILSSLIFVNVCSFRLYPLVKAYCLNATLKRSDPVKYRSAYAYSSSGVISKSRRRATTSVFDIAIHLCSPNARISLIYPASSNALTYRARFFLANLELMPLGLRISTSTSPDVLASRR